MLDPDLDYHLVAWQPEQPGDTLCESSIARELSEQVAGIAQSHAPVGEQGAKWHEVFFWVAVVAFLLIWAAFEGGLAR